MGEERLKSTNENSINPKIMDLQKDRKQKIREILVVEDTIENLAIAKKFYNSQDDFNFDYAMDRNTALSMFESKKYDGVITDQSMPAFPGDMMKNNDYLKNNGWSVALQCELKEIPWIIHSEHGSSQFYFTRKEKKFPKELAKKINDQFILDSEIKDKIKYYDSKSWDGFYELARELGNINTIQNEYDHRPGEKLIRREEEEALLENHTTSLKKSSPESWALALQYLNENIAKKIK